MYTLKKETPDGKPTASAHPGKSSLITSRCACARAARTRRNQAAAFRILTPFLPPFPYTARFSPDDKFSKQRIICKKRHGIMLTDTPDPRS